MRQLIRVFLSITPYLLILMIGLTPIIWFWGKGDVIINGVDTNFPLDPISWFSRRIYVWNNIQNAGIDFSSSIAGFFFHLIQVIPYFLGFSLQQVQAISLVFWFSLITVSSFILARVIFSKFFLIQLLFVILYSFNIYLFNTWENVKVANLALISAAPLALATLILLKEKKLNYINAYFYTLLTGIIISGSGINPSYFVSFFLIIFLYLLGEILTNLKLEIILERLKIFLLFTLLILLVNFFWILPTLNFIINNISTQGSIDKIGFTNWIDSLSENTSILNVLRGQGAWDWYILDSLTGLPSYIPYALNYFFKFPFIFFSFLLPSLAIVSLTYRLENKKNLYISFGLMILAGVFFGVGTHLPSGYLFSWLYYNVPFLTLFRSPWYIFTPLLILAIASLVSLLFYKILEKTQGSYSNIIKFTPYFLILIILTGNLFYSYPLIEGKIFRPSKVDGFFIHFPDYVFQAKDWLSTQKIGRIISYPDDEIERFSWGYIGTESIIGLLSNQETLFSPLNLPSSRVAELIKEFYKRIKMGEVDTAFPVASKLNVGTIFIKGDQPSLSPSIEKSFNNFSYVNFGPWKFYQLPSEYFVPKIYSPPDTSLVYPYSDAALISSALPGRTLLINPEDKMVNKASKMLLSSSKVVVAKNSQGEDFNNYQSLKPLLSERLLSRDLSKVVFNFEIPEKTIYQPVMEKYRLEDFGINLSKGLPIELNGQQFTWLVSNTTSSFVYFNPVNLEKGENQIIFRLENKNLVEGKDLNATLFYQKRERGDGKAKFEVADDGSEKVLSISNFGKAEAAADFQILEFDPFLKYYIEVKYRQIYGNNALTIVHQFKNDTLFKAQTERMPNHPEWQLFSFYYNPVVIPSEMKVSLDAPFTADPLGTKILYNDLKVFKVFTNNLFFINDSSQTFLKSPEIDFEKISPVKFVGTVKGENSPHVVVFSENYSPEWKISLYDLNGSKINSDPPHFSANFYANAWYIEGIDHPYKIEIFYNPQRLFWIGSVFSLATLVIGVLFSVIKLIRINR